MQLLSLLDVEVHQLVLLLIDTSGFGKDSFIVRVISGNLVRHNIDRHGLWTDHISGIFHHWFLRFLYSSRDDT